MGIGGCCFWQPTRRNRLDKQAPNDDPKVRFMKRKCRSSTTKHEQEQLRQRQQQQHSTTTLEECLLSSPSVHRDINYDMAQMRDDQCVKALKQLCKKVHPSIIGRGRGYDDYGSVNDARGSNVPTDVLLLNDIDCVGRSGKAKKRVSFKIPEKSDIFVYTDEGITDDAHIELSMYATSR